MSKKKMENNIEVYWVFPSLGCLGSICFVNKHFTRNVTVASKLLMCCLAVAMMRKVSYDLEKAAAQNMLC